MCPLRVKLGLSFKPFKKENKRTFWITIHTFLVLLKKFACHICVYLGLKVVSNLQFVYVNSDHCVIDRKGIRETLLINLLELSLFQSPRNGG